MLEATSCLGLLTIICTGTLNRSFSVCEKLLLALFLRLRELGLESALLGEGRAQWGLRKKVLVKRETERALGHIKYLYHTFVWYVSFSLKNFYTLFWRS